MFTSDRCGPCSPWSLGIVTLIGCGHSNLNLYRPRGRSRLILPSSVLHTTQSDKISASQNFREKVKRQSLQYNGEYLISRLKNQNYSHTPCFILADSSVA